MTITSSNYAPFTCEMGDLKRAQVVDEDATRTRTMFVSIGAIVASTAAVLAGVVAVAPVPH